MAKLTKKDVQHVADLAHLTLTDAQIKKFLPQLSKIVDYIGTLDEVDTSKTEPTSQTTGLTNVYREDKVKQSSINQDGALSGTDNTHNGLFKVPAILTGRTDK
jgi:aspartyl-tRNA(Asn)/glutamyl-tRNA(Gln) amidotransferase subunit C